jgi:hypothetical protein
MKTSPHPPLRGDAADFLEDVRISAASGWAEAWKVAGAIGAVALLLSGYGAIEDPKRFAHSYLFAFTVSLSVGLGALFFVLLQHLTGAGWSVSVRRSSEFLMRGLPVFLVLVTPLVLCAHLLYPWAGAERAPDPAQSGAFANAMDEGHREPLALAAANRDMGNLLEEARSQEEAHVREGRSVYMNRPFFAVRAFAFLGIWAFLAWRLFGWSTRQDDERSSRSTRMAQRLAPAATAVFSVTLVLASIDWLMSLEPLWYSTIFGVYFFAGSAVAHAACLVLVLLLLQDAGFLRRAVSIEHYHDLGKLLFGWLSFWAYIAFVQFFLIWYANIPEEVSFYHRRWDDNGGTWKPLSLALFALHFLVPFWLLLSRNAKRTPPLLATGALLVFGLHIVDVYWLVLPCAGPLNVRWLDLTCLVGVGGIYAAAVLHAMGGHPLVPLGDPRLSRALTFENS